MTRKRLKKLIMSFGYQRNIAEKMVLDANKTYRTYQQYFDDHCIQFHFYNVSNYCCRCCRVIRKFVEAASDCFTGSAGNG